MPKGIQATLPMDDFLLRAILAGIGIALISGPLGSFVVWRGMSYFGDTLAHAGLLGIALGLVLELPALLSVIVLCMMVATGLVWLQKTRQFANDTLLGILSHTMLAIGLIVISLMETVRVDLLGLLFGDILAVTSDDLIWILVCDIAVTGILLYFWRPLLSISVSEELAAIDGLPVTRIRLGLMLLIAVVIALGMKIVGILLMTSLLIIPAASARILSRSPEQMALLSSLLGALAVILGLSASYQWDLPAGPAIVVLSSMVFFVLITFKRH